MTIAENNLYDALSDWWENLDAIEKAHVLVLLSKDDYMMLYRWYKDHPDFPIQRFNERLNEIKVEASKDANQNNQQKHS